MTNTRRAAIELARRYQSDLAHAIQDERLAGILFDQLEPLHQLTPRDRLLLQTAAILHDTGLYFGSAGHHRRALQLILKSNLPGLSGVEKAIVANVARYHRKAPPSLSHSDFAALPADASERVVLLAPLLRMADALDRTHSQAVTDVRCRIENRVVEIRIGSSSDVTEEMAAVQKKGALFTQVYGRELLITLEPAR